MVQLIIYTRTGDDGTTGLGDGARRPKFDPRVAAYGEVDETELRDRPGAPRHAARPTIRDLAASRRRWRGRRTISSISAPTSALPPAKDKARRAAARRGEPGRAARARHRRAQRGPYSRCARSCCPAARAGRRGAASGARGLPARRAQRWSRSRPTGRDRRRAGASLISIAFPTICSSPRVTPTDLGRGDVLWVPGAHQSEEVNRMTSFLFRPLAVPSLPSTASTAAIPWRASSASGAITKSTRKRDGHVVDREKPFYFSKSATALRRIRGDDPLPAGHDELSFRIRAGGRARRAAFQRRRERRAASGLRLRLRPRHDAPRPAALRARQAAPMDARQGRRGRARRARRSRRPRASAIPRARRSR